MFTPTHVIKNRVSPNEVDENGDPVILPLHPDLADLVGKECIKLEQPENRVSLNASRVILEDYSIYILFNDQLEPIQ